MFYSEVWMPKRSFFSLKEEANLFLAEGLQPFSGLTSTWGDAAEGGGFSSWSNCCCHCTALCEKYFLQLRIHFGHSVKLPDSALKIFWQIDDSPSLENYQFHPMKLTNGRHCKGSQSIFDWDLFLYIKYTQIINTVYPEYVETNYISLHLGVCEVVQSCNL